MNTYNQLFMFVFLALYCWILIIHKKNYWRRGEGVKLTKKVRFYTGRIRVNVFYNKHVSYYLWQKSIIVNFLLKKTFIKNYYSIRKYLKTYWKIGLIKASPKYNHLVKRQKLIKPLCFICFISLDLFYDHSVVRREKMVY